MEFLCTGTFLFTSSQMPHSSAFSSAPSAPSLADLDRFQRQHEYSRARVQRQIAGQAARLAASVAASGTVNTFNQVRDYLVGEAAPPPEPPVATRPTMKRTAAQIENRRQDAQKRARATAVARPAYYRSMYQGRAPAASRGFNPPVEVRAVDTLSALVPFSAVSSTTGVPLDLVAAGSSFNQRTGRKIYLKSLYFNLFVGAVAFGTAHVPEYLRVVVVYDSQTNGTAPQWGDVMLSQDSTTGTIASASANLNLSNRDRFKVILDRRFYMAGFTATGSVTYFGGSTSSEMIVNEFRVLGGMETVFGADSQPPVVGDIKTGGLFLYCQGSVGSQWQATVDARLRFTD